MARTIAEIQEEIITLKKNTSVLADLNSESNTAIWRLWTYITAVAIWTLEKLFDTHRAEMDSLYSQHHAHTLNWYTNKAKAFMSGYSPLQFSSHYDTTGLTDEQISDAKIVTYAACTRHKYDNNQMFLRLKLATGNDANRQPLSKQKLDEVSEYMKSIQDAGVNLECVSYPADYIRMRWDVYYDPLILDENGNYIDNREGGTNVVRKAIMQYLQNLPFNGTYVPTYHVDAIQRVQGVIAPVIDIKETRLTALAKWGRLFDKGNVARAGWYKFYNEEVDLIVNMIPFEYGDNV